MYFLIQRGFENDIGYVTMCEYLLRADIPHSFCSVIPFSTELVFDDIEHFEKFSNGKIFVYGSYSLSKIAKLRGWVPGSFTENLSLDYLNEVYGSYMLNHDSVFCSIRECIDVPDRFFCKPMEDTKSFVAEVTDREKFFEWREKILMLSGEYSSVDGDTMIVISSIKKIYAEYRFFIIGGNVVTWSQYKLGENVVYSSMVDKYIIDFVRDVINECGKVNDAFVLDVGVTDSGLKIIECNCLNSSGFYSIDVSKFVEAVCQL